MFGRKKQAPAENPSRSGKGKSLMHQMGWTDVDDMQSAVMAGDDDDELEAELLALTQGDKEGSPQRKPSPKKKNAGMAAVEQLDNMIAQCMRDDLPDDDDDDFDLNDPDLLAELQELEDSGDEGPPAKQASPPAKKPSPPPQKQLSPPPKQASPGGSDTVQVIEERLENYKTALSNAVAAGDSSKKRRADRGVKTLNDLLKKARAGKPVAEDDIPPMMATGSSKQSPKHSPTEEAKSPAQETPMTFEPTISKVEPPSRTFSPTNAPAAPPPQAAPAAAPVARPAPAPKPSAPASRPTAPSSRQIVVPASLSAADQKTYMTLATRKEQYHTAALKAKTERGDKVAAAKLLRTSKQFESVMAALVEGKPIDLSQMPPPPQGFSSGESITAAPVKSSNVVRESLAGSASSPEEEDIPQTSAEEKKKLYKAPETANSTLEALQQRLQKYKSEQAEATESGNASKAKRHGRIVKQYETAIKDFKKGKPVEYDELPSPPGFPEIPRPSAAAAKPAPAAAPAPSRSASDQRLTNPPAANRQPSPKPKAPTLQRQSKSDLTPADTDSPPVSAMSRVEQQTLFLQERQLQFKKAALKAKQNRDMELAKKYLKMAMGFNQMIDASQAGLPVDMNQIPPPPGVKEATEGFEFVEADKGEMTGDRDEQYKKLEQDLIQQIRMCTTNSDHFTKLGDVSSAGKFDKMSQNARRDLDALKNAYKHGDPVPRFHYETRQFSLVRSCSDLGDNDLELIIVRGLNYPLPSGYQPKDLDTYVKFEFPYPNDDPQKDDSNSCKHTESPEYNQSFKVQMNRKSRAFHRILKNKSIKLEVYYKRGFLKGDKLLGTVNIKLLPLENTCIMHDSYDLMDGRKSVGGKLEVKVRIRDPFFNKEVDEVKERWLVIDHYDRKLPTAKAQQKPTQGAVQRMPERAAPVSTGNSMEVLKYEKQLLEAQIQRYRNRLDPSELSALQLRVEALDKEVNRIRGYIKQGGVAALKAYVASIEGLQNQYLAEAKTLVAQGNRDKATVLMTKKKYVEKEVEAIKAKLP